jgi:hypothetical protein
MEGHAFVALFHQVVHTLHLFVRQVQPARLDARLPLAQADGPLRCVCVCARVFACVRACERACVRACVRLFLDGAGVVAHMPQRACHMSHVFA